MITEGWIFLGMSWTAIVLFNAICLARLLSGPRLGGPDSPSERQD